MNTLRSATSLLIAMVASGCFGAEPAQPAKTTDAAEASRPSASAGRAPDRIEVLRAAMSLADVPLTELHECTGTVWPESKTFGGFFAEMLWEMQFLEDPSRIEVDAQPAKLVEGRAAEWRCLVGIDIGGPQSETPIQKGIVFSLRDGDRTIVAESVRCWDVFRPLP